MVKKLFSLSFIPILFFLVLQLFLFNKGINYTDEGYGMYNAGLILAGKIPYKDFFITTTPGEYYAWALFIKLFGNYILVGRGIFIIFNLLYIYFLYKLYPLRKRIAVLYLLFVAFILVGPGRFAVNSTEAIATTILAQIFLWQGISRKNIYFLFAAGITTGITFFFKQSFGMVLIPCFFLVCILFSRNNMLKNLLSFTVGWGLSLLVLFGYFFINHALSQALYYIFFFAAMVKSSATPFVIHRLIAAPVIFLLLIFIKKLSLKQNLILLFSIVLLSVAYLFSFPARIGRLSTYLLDPVFYLYTVTYLLPIIVLIIETKNKHQEFYKMAAIVFLCVFLGIAGSAYNISAVASVLAISIPLILYVYAYLSTYLNYLGKTIFFTAFILYMLSFIHNPFTLPVFGNHPQQELTTFSSIPQAKFIKMYPQEDKEVASIISFIQKNTKTTETVLCFPYCPMINVLTERKSPLFYSFFYQETFLAKDQNNAILALEKNPPKYVIMQKDGYIEPRASLENVRLSKLIRYLTTKYSLVFETRNFKVYH